MILRGPGEKGAGYFALLLGVFARLLSVVVSPPGHFA